MKNNLEHDITDAVHTMYIPPEACYRLRKFMCV